MTRTLAIGGVAALALSAAACSVTTTGAQCKVDDNCQTGQYCATLSGEAGTCQLCTCGSGLLCSGGSGSQPQCSCPVNTSSTFYADANSGSLLASAMPPTGVQSPAQCRFKSLGEALSAANAAGSGSTVAATGSSGEGGMNFQETGPLTIGPGVVVTSDAATADYYAVTAPATTAPFITMSAGATLSGFAVQSGNAKGNAIQSACASGSGSVTIVNVSVIGAGSAGFEAGISHSGACDLDLESSSITGTGQCGVVLNPSASASVTVLNNVVTGNLAVAVPAVSRTCGGVLLLQAPAAPAILTVQGNQVYANEGDQVLVYLGASNSGSVTLGGGANSSACGTTSNFFACYGGSYGSGVGVFSDAATTNLSYNQWTATGSPAFGIDYDCPTPVTTYCPPDTTFICPPAPHL